ncbi:MAG: hypothetical protein CL730_00815 [Chloroflexi bacterium]|nr:hypothetical protein [Chloroflexota bacterium]MBO98801.1 hypothetical protein [Chloroflexota bacterium]
MSIIKSFKGKFIIFSELISFLWKAKLWWMIPMISVMVILSMIIIFGTSTALGPFIYTLF